MADHRVALRQSKKYLNLFKGFQATTSATDDLSALPLGLSKKPRAEGKLAFCYAEVRRKKTIVNGSLETWHQAHGVLFVFVQMSATGFYQ